MGDFDSAFGDGNDNTVAAVFDRERGTDGAGANAVCLNDKSTLIRDSVKMGSAVEQHDFPGVFGDVCCYGGTCIKMHDVPTDKGHEFRALRPGQMIGFIPVECIWS
ncbi:MAG: hypothetical protein AAF968_07395 [Pseudomonadota bacterium]